MREFNKEIGARLRKFRKSRGMSQMQTAEAAGMALQTYAKLEKGESEMKAHHCVELAKLFCTTCDMILQGNTTSTDAGFTAEKLDRLLQITGQAKVLADEIYGDAFEMKVGANI